MPKASASLTAIFGALAIAALVPLTGCLAHGHGKDRPQAGNSISEGVQRKPSVAERLVRLYGPVDGELADNVKGKLRELDAADPGKPITMVITSKGGLVPAGLDIIDTMDSLKSPVNTLCERWCTSIAAVITAAGAHRSSQPHAILRFHDVQLDDDPQLRDLEEQHLLDILAAHSATPKEGWAEVFRAGKFISPQRALELGALDEIQKPVRPVPPSPAG